MELSLKNLLLAGIGSMAASYEKAQQTVEELVRKGELTVSQGRELNEELKHTVREKKDEVTQAQAERMRRLAGTLGLVTKDDLTALNERLDRLEKLLEQK